MWASVRDPDDAGKTLRVPTATPNASLSVACTSAPAREIAL